MIAVGSFKLLAMIKLLINVHDYIVLNCPPSIRSLVINLIRIVITLTSLVCWRGHHLLLPATHCLRPVVIDFLRDKLAADGG